MKGQSECVTSYMGPWWAGGLGAGCSWLWLSTPRTPCIQQWPPSDYYLFWNL